MALLATREAIVAMGEDLDKMGWVNGTEETLRFGRRFGRCGWR